MDSPRVAGKNDAFASLNAQVSKLEARLGHYTVLAEQIPAVFWTTDCELRITASAGVGLQVLGVKPGTAVGQSLMEYLGIEDPEAPPIPEHRRALAGEAVSYDYEFQDRCLQCRVEPLRQQDGTIAGTIGIALDITERVRLEEALRHRIAIESLLTDISKHFVALCPEDLDSGIDHALRRVGEFAGADRAYVFQFSVDQTTVSNTHEWCANGIKPQIHTIQNLNVTHIPWSFERFTRLETIHIPLVSELPPEAAAEREVLEAQDIQSLLLMPMAAGGRLLGFLGFDSVREPKTWSDEDAALLRTIAEIVAGALDRGRTELALRESEAVSRSLVGANPDIVFRFSREGRHLTCHIGETESDWLQPQTLVGRAVEEAHPPGFAALCRRAIEEVLRTRSVQEYEYCEPIEGGGRFWEVRAAPCGSEEVLVIVRNVTRRKTTEAELRERDRFLSSLISSLPGYVYRCSNDPEWTMEYLSDGIHEMLGFGPDAFIHERSVSVGGLIHPEDRRRVWDDVQSALRERRRFQIVYRLRTASGEYRWVWEQGGGVYAEDGTVEAIEGFVADITERKQGEESLARSHRLLRLTLSEMDHRVRNNLAAIIALIDLTAKRYDSVAQFSESIRSRVQAMGTVHTALSRSRWAETTLRELIATLMPGDLDSTLHLDGPDVHLSSRQSAAIGMVLHELFANSLKYGALREPHGCVDVKWGLRQSLASSEDTMLELTWREQCPNPIRTPVVEGLGTRLIHGVLRNELRGRATLTYPPSGAEHRLVFRIDGRRGPLRAEVESDDAEAATEPDRDSRM